MTSTLKSNVTLSATVLAIALGGFAVQADAKSGEGRRDHRASFAELDSNGDGLVTEAELSAHRVARFASMDADGDGKVTAEELTAHHDAKISRKLAKRTAHMVNRFDADGDGALSQDELPQKGFMSKFMERADSNGDGALSQEEFETARAKMKDRMNSRDGKWFKKNKHGQSDPVGAGDGN